MFTTGSKLLIGSATAVSLFAVMYGVMQGGTLGTIGLISAATSLWLLAGVNAAIRDANVSALDTDAFATSAAARTAPGQSLWPLLTAIGATSMTLGLVVNRTFFIVGLIAVIAGAAEWMVQAWSERASSDEHYNAVTRAVMAHPLELPVAAAIGGGVVVYSFSRVMLGLPTKTATVVAFVVVAALVLAVGTLLGFKRSVSKATLTGAFSLAAVALIAGGTIAGLNGERETHPHETPADLAEENRCGTEETEVDENASQSLGAKSNLAAEVIFDGSSLNADVPGFDGDFEALTLPRSNPSNVLFRNESDEARRFVLELHPELDADGVPLGAERLCTALVEPDGVQLLTIVIGRPSFALDEPYAVSVPGTDATLEVVVP